MGNNGCLVAYHWQMDFSVLRQCLGSASAVEQPLMAIPHTKHGQVKNRPKITTYDHVHQIFITSCKWFRRGDLCDRGSTVRGIYRNVFLPYKTMHNDTKYLHELSMISWYIISNEAKHIGFHWFTSFCKPPTPIVPFLVKKTQKMYKKCHSICIHKHVADWDLFPRNDSVCKWPLKV